MPGSPSLPDRGEPALTAAVFRPKERPDDFNTPIVVSISAKDCTFVVSEIVSGSPADAGILIHRCQPNINRVTARHVGGKFQFVFYYKWRAVFLTYTVLCFLFMEAAKNTYVHGPGTSLAFTLPVSVATVVWHIFYYCAPLSRSSRFYEFAGAAVTFGLFGLDCAWEYVRYRQDMNKVEN